MLEFAVIRFYDEIRNFINSRNSIVIIIVIIIIILIIIIITPGLVFIPATTISLIFSSTLGYFLTERLKIIMLY